jgi:spectinomycin phosphotransferase
VSGFGAVHADLPYVPGETGCVAGMSATNVASMRDEPAELTLRLVAECLDGWWGIQPADLNYAPVGNGSYHWIAADHAGPRWFVKADHLAGTVDDLAGTLDQRFAMLAAAADTSRHLVADGLEFVLAPLPDRTGALVRRVLPGWALQVFPYVTGRSTDQGSWTDPDEQAEVARFIGRLHTATPPSTTPRWKPALPSRAALESALDDLDQPWTGGPYAETARAFVTESRTTIEALVRRYDGLVHEIEADTDPWVVTHGEPDSDNVIRAANGRMYLIDWGAVKLAPRERDLVEIFNGTVDVLPSYQETAGPHTPRPVGVELFTLGWSLLEICRKVQLFQNPHPGYTAATPEWERLRHEVENPGSWFQPQNRRATRWTTAAGG